MNSLIYLFAKSLLIFLGIIIIIVSKKIPYKLIKPNLSKCNLLDKNSYVNEVRRTIFLIGLLDIILGFLSIVNINIYFYIIFIPSILILNMNKNLKKFHELK